MPPSNLLRLHATQNRPSLPSENPVSATATSSTATRGATHLEQCEYCFRIIPVKSTRQHHIAATPKCRAAEQAEIRAGRREREAQRQTEQLSDLYAREAAHVPQLSEPVGRTQEPPVKPPVANIRQPLGHRPESCKAMVPTAPDDAPSRVEPPMPAGSSLPAPNPPAPNPPVTNAQRPLERHPKRHKTTVETVPDTEAPSIVEPRAPTVSNPPAPNPSAPPAREALHTRTNPVTDTLSGRVSPAPGQPRPSSAQSRAGGRGALRRWKGLYVEDFPDPLAGAPISEERIPEPDLGAYMRSCGTLADPWNFEIAEMLLTSRMTDEAKDRHLKSRLYEGQTPWPNVEAMNSDVDKLPHGPDFELHDIDIFDGQRPRVQFMVSRDLIQSLRDMFGNRSFENSFYAAPERHWLSPHMDQRMYSDMRSAEWWWREQEKMRGKGAVTIAPLIISTDQTNLSTMCGGQKAYPLYISSGNFDKPVRRKEGGMVLLGLLPVEPFEDVKDDNERRCLKAELVHRAMEKMLEPLKQASEEGIEMWCPDGRLRRVYPRVAAYMADWPEQNLHSCTSEGSCPVCSVAWADRGNEEPGPLREREETLNAIRAYFAYRDVGELRQLNLRPVWPWWGDLPHVNLASCFTPDLLHQLYQGVFKSHLVRWLKHLVGVDKIDERFAAMPQAEGMRHFVKGITSVQQWTGRESKEMVSQILPIVIGELTPEESRLVRSVIDFVFRAHASSMTDRDIEELERDLAVFHEFKQLLVVKGFYQSEKRFNRIPKIHMLSHYARSIRELGTPDGYNTEVPERLHIQYAKIPWRASSKDEDEEDGEVVEIENGTQESIGSAVEDGMGVTPDSEGIAGDTSADAITYPNPRRHMAANPTKHNVPVKEVMKSHGASDLPAAITRFMTDRLGVPEHDVLLSPYNRLDLWHRLYLRHQPLPFAPFEPPRRDVVRAIPTVLTQGGRIRKEAVWDTALYLERPNRFRSGSDNGEEKHGILRYRAGRVRALFTLPGHLRHYYSGQLAYLEVFAPFDASVSPFAKMHSTQPDFDSRNRRRTLVVPVTEIVMACHLAPKFHRLDEELQLTPSTDLLAVSKHFWLNHYYSHFFFQLVQHWWRRRPTLLERLLRYAR
ncbi:hypothetical protein FRC08_018133 [Ceratobasidium sp. 394]|nr:hypothetical protein FRC08_018133 [Ceratobasidium sp. 394]